MTFHIGRQIISKPGEPALPPVRTIAANALKAAGRVIAAKVQGRAVWLTPAQSEAHKAICESNQCGFYRARDQRCAHPKCGCFTRLKTRMATEDCPAGLFSGA
jgi:hypothetical protein